MPDEARYLFVAIDRATRGVFIGIYPDQTDASAMHFLERLHAAAPMRITKLLTDNGSPFTDRFQSKARKSTGEHHFDVRCKALGIEHRLAPPRHPQTNGMVERLNARSSEMVAQTRFRSAPELEEILRHHVRADNQQIAQRALLHRTPIQALKDWQTKQTALFKKMGKNQPGLDT